MWKTLLAVLSLVAATAWAEEQAAPGELLGAAAGNSDLAVFLVWPEDQPGVIPDARLYERVRAARQEAHEASGRASDAQAVAGQARRRLAARRMIGRSARPQMIDDETIMTAVPYASEQGPMLGVVTYPDGANMTGEFGSDLGIYDPAPESAMTAFNGWVFGAASAYPQPMTGVFEFKNGERFIGSYLAGSNARGVYRSSDGQRRFVGEIDFTGGRWRPVAGIVEDRRGRLLAVVR